MSGSGGRRLHRVPYAGEMRGRGGAGTRAALADVRLRNEVHLLACGAHAGTAAVFEYKGCTRREALRRRRRRARLMRCVRAARCLGPARACRAARCPPALPGAVRALAGELPAPSARVLLLARCVCVPLRRAAAARRCSLLSPSRRRRRRRCWRARACALAVRHACAPLSHPPISPSPRSTSCLGLRVLCTVPLSHSLHSLSRSSLTPHSHHTLLTRRAPTPASPLPATHALLCAHALPRSSPSSASPRLQSRPSGRRSLPLFVPRSVSPPASDHCLLSLASHV
jgi:hypothetical protein